MKNFPIEKYHFYIATKIDGTPYKVIATSTYCGRTIRGVAKCNPEDGFDMEKGKALAAARCNLKVAEKRANRAHKAYREAREAIKKAEQRFHDMDEYSSDARKAYLEAKKNIENLLSEM